MAMVPPATNLGLSFGRLLYAIVPMVLIIWLVSQWDEKVAMGLAAITLLAILLTRPGLADRLASLLKGG